MLDICCPGVYPGVLLWPICHPYILGGAPSRVENAPLRHGSVILAVQIRFGPDRHFSESMGLPSWELVHSLGDPLLSRSSVCSSFRPVSGISAHCSHLRGSSHLDSTRTLVPRTAHPKPYYDPQLQMSLATRRGHSPCCGSLRSVPGSG